MQSSEDGAAKGRSAREAAIADGEKRRAAAICEHCGSVHVVHVFPDGVVRVIGTSGACDCGGDDFRILGGSTGPDATTEGTAASETTGV